MTDVATGRPGQVVQDAVEELFPATGLGLEKLPERPVGRKREAAIERTPKLVEEAGTILRTSRAWPYATP
jgi:hypothetical protein